MRVQKIACSKPLPTLTMASNSLNKLLDPQTSALAASLNNVNSITGT